MCRKALSDFCNSDMYFDVLRRSVLIQQMNYSSLINWEGTYIVLLIATTKNIFQKMSILVA